MSVPMEKRIALVRLGRDFEKAYHGRQPEKVRSTLTAIDAICQEYPEEWLTPLVCRGQNIYRRARGQGEVYPLD